MKDETMNEADL